MRIGEENWLRRWVVGSGGFIGEVTLMSVFDVPPERQKLAYLGPRCVALTNMYVHPLRRGRGWASRLLDVAMEYADAHDLSVVLWALPYGTPPRANAKALVTLYESYGFKHLKDDYMLRPCVSWK